MNPWLAGAIGWWVLGGPIGGLIGFFGAQFLNKLARSVDEPQQDPEWERQAREARERWRRERESQQERQAEQQWERRQSENRQRYRRTPPPHAATGEAAGADGNFAVSLMVLVAAVMMADGRATRDELAVVKTFLRDHFDADFSRNALRLLKGLLSKNFDLPPVCRQIRQNMDIAARRTLLHLLYGVAWADGVLHPAEERVLAAIAAGLGISAAEARSISSMFARTGAGPEADYAILGVSPDATDAEIRSAFRKMALKHHPDKVAHLGPEFQRDATEKFRAINEAYDRIRKSRGIS